MKYIRILLIVGLCATPALSISDRAIETIFRGSVHALVGVGTAPWMESRVQIVLHIHLVVTQSVLFRLTEYGLHEVLSITAATWWWYQGLTLYTYDLIQGMNNLNQVVLRGHDR
jgi:hypothetical protein